MALLLVLGQPDAQSAEMRFPHSLRETWAWAKDRTLVELGDFNKKYAGAKVEWSVVITKIDQNPEHGAWPLVVTPSTDESDKTNTARLGVKKSALKKLQRLRVGQRIAITGKFLHFTLWPAVENVTITVETEASKGQTAK